VAISYDEYPCCFPFAGPCSGSDQYADRYVTYAYTRGVIQDEWEDGDHLIAAPGMPSTTLCAAAKRLQIRTLSNRDFMHDHMTII
jgi:hypothetical protein